MSNRLQFEKSPYLLQHANNPVDWFPWSEEAFAKARAEDKPIFLSAGYSTCHWCHVMERESFENDALAAVLNEHFVAIKVDREERPDVDRIYMLFVQATTGSGGWPMSVWLTPDGRPFYGGTYFPPDNRYGRPGFRAVLESLSRAWKQDRERIEQAGREVVEQLSGHVSAGRDNEGAVTQADLDTTYRDFRRSFDSHLGGFGHAPKFPRPSIYHFLLRYFAATGERDALEMVLHTLREMSKGGMNDQLGGGFHRYSVDERWFVPHFEKMLYDQAQLVVSFLEAYQITSDEQYAAEARRILDYVLRDLTHPDGGFYSAEDADSASDPAHPHEKGEGAFYIWTAAELRETLGERDAALFGHYFGVRAEGNVSEDPHAEFTGRNILYQARPVDATAAHFGVAASVVEEAIARAVPVLMARRATRPRPHLDDKILAAWNGMMLSAFAKAAQILEEPRYESAARRCADHLRHVLWRESDLLRRHRDGESAVPGFLDDYAFLANGLIDLYETQFNSADLAWAVKLIERARELFEDPDGGFFSTRAGQADLVMRLKDDYDGAEPSGNSAMIHALLRAGRRTRREDFLQSAERALTAFRGRARTQGTGLPYMLSAQLLALTPPMEIVLGGELEGAILRTIRQRFLPNTVILRTSEAPQEFPSTQERSAVYVCANFSCNLPVFSAESLEPLLPKRLQ